MKSSTLGLILIGIGVLGFLSVLGLNIVVLGLGIFFIVAGLRFFLMSSGRLPEGQIKAFLIPADAAETAKVNITHAAGRLSVGRGNTENALVEGRCSDEVYPSATRRADEVNVSVGFDDTACQRFIKPWEWQALNWNLALMPEVPMDLHVKSAIGSSKVDCRGIALRKLHIEFAMGSSHIVMPDSAGHTDVHVETGMSALQIDVPPNVAARIKADGFGGLHIDTQRFPRNGDYYQSPDYNTASNRLDCKIEFGLSNITVE